MSKKNSHYKSAVKRNQDGKALSEAMSFNFIYFN